MVGFGAIGIGLIEFHGPDWNGQVFSENNSSDAFNHPNNYCMSLQFSNFILNLTIEDPLAINADSLGTSPRGIETPDKVQFTDPSKKGRGGYLVST